jgi:hypothetical protein
MARAGVLLASMSVSSPRTVPEQAENQQRREDQEAGDVPATVHVGPAAVRVEMAVVFGMRACASSHCRLGHG